jgi:hypothetical protein
MVMINAGNDTGNVTNAVATVVRISPTFLIFLKKGGGCDLALWMIFFMVLFWVKGGEVRGARFWDDGLFKSLLFVLPDYQIPR